jgi:putative SOS response-associated peptidase YedK
MCGRFYLDASTEQLIAHFGLVDAAPQAPRYNISPSQRVAVVRQKPDGPALSMLRWGLVPAWAKQAKSPYSMINARAETVAIKPAWRRLFRERRGLIPATGFYEWQAGQDGKQPFNIGLRERGIMAFAGLWDRWQGEDGEVIESCSIIVTEANARLRDIHDRMPVILKPADYASWLDPDNHDIVSLGKLLVPFDAAGMDAYPVSRLVNNPANDTPRCLEPNTA